MERSQRLGRCICDPRRPCPCEVFRQQGLCPCAGERPEAMDLSGLKLTQLVRNAGCASKIAPADLDAVLTRLPPVNDPAVISGLAAADDAAIYRLADDLCLVQTVDVFTPCVDDPRLFGRICAANCLSDIYAMGGTPRTALSILAFPSEALDGELMYRMLAGAMETLAEAQVALVGGHSIKDEEIKLGFAVTGLIEPNLAKALDTPSAGDLLVLTKPLGTGVLSFLRQAGREPGPGLAAAEASMATLNRAAAEAMIEAGASACTDVTGFGLFGHLIRMARQASLVARVYADSLPSFEGVLGALRDGVIPGAVERNREYLGEDLEVEAAVEEALVNLGFDAQTSGGLLIAIPPERLDAWQKAAAARQTRGYVIGELLEPGQGRILLSASRSLTAGAPQRSANVPAGAHAVTPPASQIGIVPEPPSCRAGPAQSESQIPKAIDMNTPPSDSETHPPGCCADFFDPKPAETSAAQAQSGFSAMMRAVQSPGALDARTKELILFSLVVQSRCAPCFQAHYQKARQMGITQAQLDEAAWCAIAMAGAPARMFYEDCLRAAG
jgi:selenide, water dikinase